MRVLISEHELGDGAAQSDAAAVVEALRAAGIEAYTTDRRPGDLNADAGERPLAWLIETARAAERARAAVTGEDFDSLDGVDFDTQTVVARVDGHPPLRKPAGVWRRLDLETRTAVIAGYFNECKSAVRNAQRDAEIAQMTASCTPRVAKLIGLVMGAIPLDDRLRLQERRVKFHEGLDEYGMSIKRAGSATRDEIRIKTDGKSDKAILRVIAHEVFHVTRDHPELLSFAETDEEAALLHQVFERQTDAFTEKLVFAALPDSLKIV